MSERDRFLLLITITLIGVFGNVVVTQTFGHNTNMAKLSDADSLFQKENDLPPIEPINFEAPPPVRSAPTTEAKKKSTSLKRDSVKTSKEEIPKPAFIPHTESIDAPVENASILNTAADGSTKQASWTYFFIGFLVLALLGSIYKIITQQQLLKKATKLREAGLKQRVELEQHNEQLQEQLARLKVELAQVEHQLSAAQEQLIIQDKHATFGQLLAGIAHEIKNPLNFITNFSDVTKELAQELQEDLEQYRHKIEKADFEDLTDTINDIAQNAKVTHTHSMRANRIIRNLMDHARGSEDERRPEDINKLLEENLKLAYNGYRAQKPAFNASINKDFDQSTPFVPIIAHDLGRALLNLFNNAFYALHQKQKSTDKTYTPTLSVKTTTQDDHLIIKVHDNGPGIPERIREKIFNPFFTTKPSGEGNTGLGLAISKEIITEKHLGQMNVESEAGMYTAFVIKLPLNLS